MSIPDVTASDYQFDTWRNRLAARLANAALLLANDDYRNFITGAIKLGMLTAAKRADYMHEPDHKPVANSRFDRALKEMQESVAATGHTRWIPIGVRHLLDGSQEIVTLKDPSTGEVISR